MTHRSGGAAAGILLAAAAGLYVVAAWQSPPGFYDGFAPPADSYRWVKAPDGVTSNGLKPLPGSASLPVSSDHTRVAAGAVATGEKPPQARLTIPAGAFSAPAVDSVAVDLTPTAAPSRPENAVVAGNLYCVSSTASLARGQQLELTLTYSAQLPGADAIYRYDDTALSWIRLPTTRDGAAATVSAAISSLGCYAPASVAAAGAAASPRRSGVQVLPYVVAGLIMVAIAGLPLYLRLRRERRLRDRA